MSVHQRIGMHLDLAHGHRDRQVIEEEGSVAVIPVDRLFVAATVGYVVIHARFIDSERPHVQKLRRRCDSLDQQCDADEP